MDGLDPSGDLDAGDLDGDDVHVSDVVDDVDVDDAPDPDDRGPDDLDPDELEPAAWCEECEQVVEPEDIDEDGTCPDCGSVLVAQPRRHVPWYFKGMLVATVIYLGYRAYQGVGWIAHHL